MVQTCVLRPHLFSLNLTWWRHGPILRPPSTPFSLNLTWWRHGPDLLPPSRPFSPWPHLMESLTRLATSVYIFFSFASPDSITVQIRHVRPQVVLLYLTWWRHGPNSRPPSTPFYLLPHLMASQSRFATSVYTFFSQSYLIAPQSRLAISVHTFFSILDDGLTVQICYLHPTLPLLDLTWWRHGPVLLPPSRLFSPWPHLMASRSSFAMSVHTFLSFTRRRTMGTSLSLGHAPRLICFSRVNSLQDMALKLIRCSRNNVANRQVKFQGAMTKTNI